MAKEPMRSGAVIEVEPGPVQHPNSIGWRADRQARHRLKIDVDAFDRCWNNLDGNFFAVLDQAFQVTSDGILCHRARFVEGIAFGHEPGKCGNGNSKAALRSCFEYECVAVLRHYFPLTPQKLAQS